MKKTIFVFSSISLALLLLFQLSKYTYLRDDLSIEIIIALIAILFLGLGIYLNKNSLHKNNSEATEIDQKQIAKLGISNREYEVLVEISKGLSNKEIAEKLFVTESTIKTHVSNILVKLDSKRRTQAIQKAKEFHILPA
ncbi:response regulator transcription factor [Croceitalea rosinachiae]|uniref:Response regulator transcription factor n=1 Tax=Croceitalea rosinachiae TaxID=3075596 RepID=A0ABU3A6R4_9FLAO|nr:response regulator transcription factor [Croceitalea sp. F388]MDT0605862.1 response regulator transcription factor [Croceitalea sp. F388]